MKRIIKTVGLACIVVIGLTSCGFGSLPYDERYARIDRVLTDIDYQNIGTVVREEMDDGDGIFISSYKEIYYQEEIFLDVLVPKLQNPPEDINTDCNNENVDKNDTVISCNYEGTSIVAGTITSKESGYKSYIKITDPTSGR